MRLPETHPAAHEHLSKGNSCVQRSDFSAFSQVPVDQCIEQTMNQDTKNSRRHSGIQLESWHSSPLDCNSASSAKVCNDLSLSRTAHFQGNSREG